MEDGDGVEDARSHESSPGVERVDLPSMSNASLTPPPPTSEDAGMEKNNERGAWADGDEEIAEDEAMEVKGQGGDDWEEYRKHRSVRGFTAKSEVKVEPGEEDEDGDDTPQRYGKKRSRMRPHHAGNDTASGETPASNSERVGSTGRAGRRRRGEEELLLDDHLLPPDVRKIGELVSRRVNKPESTTEDEEPRRHDADRSKSGDQHVDEAPIEGEDEGVTEVEYGDEREEMTRCVCRTEGELCSTI